MKTLLIIAIVLLLVISFDIIIDKFFISQLEYYEEHINNIILLIQDENYENIEDDMDILLSTWDENVFSWNILCDHAEIESIELLFHAAKEDIINAEYDNAKKTLTELLHSIDNSSNRYKLRWENVL